MFKNIKLYLIGRNKEKNTVIIIDVVVMWYVFTLNMAFIPKAAAAYIICK